jgi:hypothetical protein
LLLPPSASLRERLPRAVFFLPHRSATALASSLSLGGLG